MLRRLLRMDVDDPYVESYSAPNYPPEPPKLGVLQAMWRSLPLVVLPVLVLVAAAIAYGLTRSPTYTSEARLNVGGLNLTQVSIQGYTAAVSQLAVAYSRALDATAVIDPVSHETGLSKSAVVDHISATPVEGSPVIRIRGTSKDADEARRLADSAASSLTAYARRLNSRSSSTDDLRRRYIRASRRYRAARALIARLKLNDPRRKRASVRADVTHLEQQTAAALYGQSQAGQATTNLVQRLAPAAPATSDRDQVLERLLAAALIAGLLIGIGLAVARSNRVAARRLGLR